MSTQLSYSHRAMFLAQSLIREERLRVNIPKLVEETARNSVTQEFNLGMRGGIGGENSRAVAAQYVSSSMANKYKVPNDTEQIVRGTNLGGRAMQLAMELDADVDPMIGESEIINQFIEVIKFGEEHPEKAPELVLIAQTLGKIHHQVDIPQLVEA